MGRPRNIILLVADSLRYDSVHGDVRAGGSGLPFTTAHATRFTQARSGGCWTLPATASLFTGLMPHEHGADSQSRGMRTDVPTLAEAMREQGFRTHQITANVATTEIFGLDRGYDEVHRIWNHVSSQHKKIHEALVLIGKPRLRKKILSADFVSGKLSEDLEASKVWLQDTVGDVFDAARQRLETNEKDGKQSFLFLNLMETHFPYHVGPTFETTADTLIGKMREIVSLFHLVNQTWLTQDNQPIRDDMMKLLRQRQRLAWERLAPQVDAFIQEMHAQGNLVVFGSDHGDNFGEQGWVYHFSNVTDAGNHVPLYWIDPADDTPRVIDTPVSTRDVYHGLLTAVGDQRAAFSPVTEPERSFPIMQSCWYNNQGKTLEKYRYNQICLLEGGTRWMRRRNEWFSAPPATNGTEIAFTRLPPGFDPLEEGVIVPERRGYLRSVLEDFGDFSARVEA
ncbi:MAG: sulfatase-like hydrolase/transferase [Pseudomonadota bacterium]|nr:sulfatase-like hydrolase/transferase [Pseudomonadota bacterium]